MRREILINVAPVETRIALIENAVPQQIYIDSKQQQSLVGNIYKAVVLRVMRGMQAAFLDIGDERSAFLHIDKMCVSDASFDIHQLLHPGQEILVQVLKDPIKNKGAQLTTDFSIATSHMVYKHSVSKLGVSLQIKAESERQRLNAVMADILPMQDRPKKFSGSFILRTAAEGLTTEQLKWDLEHLYKILRDIENSNRQVAPCCLYSEPPLYQRVLVDLAGLDIDRILIDDDRDYSLLKDFADRALPNVKDRIARYNDRTPLFELFHTEDELKLALESKVPLNCGGYLIVEETEAMTVVDVNTGSFVGSNNFQQTICQTNLEAVEALSRQIRLRNLSGIIVVDFIDMDNADNRHQVIQALELALANDRIKTKVSGMSELGLVQISRKRSMSSLKQMLCEPCTVCDAKGVIRSAQTISCEILRELIRITGRGPWQSLDVYASSEVIEQLQNEFAAQLADIEVEVSCKVRLYIESSTARDPFKIIPS